MVVISERVVDVVVGEGLVGSVLIVLSGLVEIWSGLRGCLFTFWRDRLDGFVLVDFDAVDLSMGSRYNNMGLKVIPKVVWGNGVCESEGVGDILTAGINVVRARLSRGSAEGKTAINFGTGVEWCNFSYHSMGAQREFFILWLCG